eukprot:gene21941-42126_t
MQIVSGLLGREVVHYTAPPSSQMDAQMKAFLNWFEMTRPGRKHTDALDGIARAAIAHLWFESIHPFEDGNGRIGRAIIDLALAQDAGAPQRLVSLSHQLLAQRRGYYNALQTAQHGGTDVSGWVLWFVQQYMHACDHSGSLIQVALEKSRFWAQHAVAVLNARQRKVVQRLLDDGNGGFLGGLNAEKYMKMTGTSKATATRDLAQLVQDRVLFTRGQGKALRYFVNVPGWEHPDRCPARNRCTSSNCSGTLSAGAWPHPAIVTTSARGPRSRMASAVSASSKSESPPRRHSTGTSMR